MSVVSPHALWACEQELLAHGTNRERWLQIAGLPESFRLHEPCSWEDAAELIDAAADIVGRAGLRSAGRRLVSHPVISRVHGAFPRVTHPDASLHLLAMVLGGVVLPTSHWTVHAVSEGSTLTGSLNAHDVSCPNAFLIVSGAAEFAPTLFGFRPAHVALRSTDRVASFLVDYDTVVVGPPTPPSDMMGLATRLLRAVSLELTATRTERDIARRQNKAYELVLADKADQGRRG